MFVSSYYADCRSYVEGLEFKQKSKRNYFKINLYPINVVLTNIY